MLGRRGAKRRAERRRIRLSGAGLVAALGLILSSLIVGLMVSIIGWADTTSAIDDLAAKGRIVRPVLLVLAFLLFPTMLRYAGRFGVIPKGMAVLLYRERVRLFAWIAIIEVTLGQGLLIPGLLAGLTFLIVSRRRAAAEQLDEAP